ncbi:MAG: ParB N-terminal domain-containing protein [Gammaproteobacteria bacterium]|nr:ParB N-terminal domain-containing protein [Gammaproteobacteria bacterium]
MKDVIEVPFNKLTVASDNPRTAPITKGQHDEMVASISARGIMVPLMVRPATKKGHYDVWDGGLRLAAFATLVEKGEKKATFKIRCILDTEDNTLDKGLAANLHRTSMHPVDQFEAFAALRENGVDNKEISKRFHIPVNEVNQRLSLGDVAPEIRNACREGVIGVDALKAFTVVTDIERQLAVFNEFKNYGHFTSYNIRNKLTEGKVKSTESIARFVGEKDYKKAGGFVSKDLFETDTYFDDRGLLEELASKKLEKELKKIAGPWKWGEVQITVDTHGFSREHPVPTDVPADLVKEQEQVNAEIVALEEVADAKDEWSSDDCDKSNELDKKYDAIEERIRGCVAYSDDQYSRSGVIVSIDYNGSLKVTKGLVRPEDCPTPEIQGHSTSDSSVSTPAKPVHSQALTEDLKAWRLPVMQLAVASNPETAIDLMLHDLVDNMSHSYSRAAGTTLSARETYQSSSLKDLNDHLANIELATIEEDIRRLTTPDEDTDLLVHLSALSMEDKHRVLAWCLSRSVNAGLNGNKPEEPVLEAIGQRHDVDVAKYWRPTAVNYLNRVTKASLLGIGDYILGTDVGFMEKHRSETKATVVSLVSSLLKGEYDGMTDDQLERAATWLPEGMDYNPVDAEDASEALDGDGLPRFLSDNDDIAGEAPEEENQPVAA